MKKKIAIIGAGIAGLTFANLLKKNLIMNLCYTKNKKVYPWMKDTEYNSTNSIKILNTIGFNKIDNSKIFHPKELIFITLKIKKSVK